MRKMLLIPLISCMVALLLTLWMPALHATEPTTVSIKCDGSIPDPNMEVRFAGGNTIVHAWGGGGMLLEPFVGKWIHDERMVVHPSGRATVNGVWDTPDGVTFTDVSGTKHSGTIHVRYWGKADAATGVFRGKWVIISGTGDLANLRGHGSIWFDPAIDPLFLRGFLKYHFDP